MVPVTNSYLILRAAGDEAIVGTAFIVSVLFLDFFFPRFFRFSLSPSKQKKNQEKN